jgi:arylsulfatase
VPAQVIVKQFMQTMVEFPPRQKAARFTVGDVMEKLEQNSAQMARSAGAGT